MLFLDCICMNHHDFTSCHRPSLADSGVSSSSNPSQDLYSPTHTIQSTNDTLNSGSLISSKYVPVNCTASSQFSDDDTERMVKDELKQFSRDGNFDHSILLSKYPNSILAQFSLAQSFESRGDAANINKAINAYKRCLALSRNNHSPTWAALGHIYACNKFDFGSAVVCFKHLVELEPRKIEHHNTLGLALIALGRAKEALGAYACGLRIDSNHIELNYNCALVWHDLKAIDQAQLGYKKVIALCKAQLDQASSCESIAKTFKMLVESQDHLALLYSERDDLKGALSIYQEMDFALLTSEMKSSVLQSIEFLKREIEARRM